MLKRFLAREVIENTTGKRHGLSMVQFDCTTGLTSITPFIGETHSTAMVDGTIIVDRYKLVLKRKNEKDRVLAQVTLT
ncbi:MAG: hypothetical protein J1E84_08000 [Muribaculaceae bacterium]|nr:hypothetical protein [Muribaculaceae bacterium]